MNVIFVSLLFTLAFLPNSFGIDVFAPKNTFGNSSGSGEINPSLPQAQHPPCLKEIHITFYGDDDNNLRPLRSVQYQLVRDLRFYIGVNVSGILRPMFDDQGNMVIVRIRDHENLHMPTPIAKKYRFVIPPWQLEALEAYRSGRKQHVSTQPSTPSIQPQIQPNTGSTGSYTQQHPEHKAQYYYTVRQQEKKSLPSATQPQKEADSQPSSTAKQT